MPLRTCVGCRTKGDKEDFERFVAGAEGPVLDESGHAAGRGAYVCPGEVCLTRALESGSLSRALRLGRNKKNR